MAEGKAVAARIASLHARGVRYADQAVVAWAHSDLDSIAKALAADRIPAIHVGDLKAYSCIAHARDFLAFVIDGKDAEFSKIAAARPYCMSATAIRRIEEHARRENRTAAGWLLEHMSQDADDKDGASKRQCHLAADVKSFGTEPIADALVDWIFAPSGRVRSLLREGSGVSGTLELIAVHHLLLTCRDYPQPGERYVAGLVGRLQSMGSRDQRTHFRRLRLQALDIDAVPFLTVHAARGFEFAVIHAAGLWTPTHRHESGEPATPSNNILRVAISRGRQETHLTWPKSRGRKNVRPMPGLAGLGQLAEPSL